MNRPDGFRLLVVDDSAVMRTMVIRTLGMTGDEMIADLRSRPETCALPILVISTERSAARIAELAAQRVAFINKPFSPEALRIAILGILGAPDADVHAIAGHGDDLDF